jgi:hypothetical protein
VPVYAARLTVNGVVLVRAHFGSDYGTLLGLQTPIPQCGQRSKLSQSRYLRDSMGSSRLAVDSESIRG